MYLIRAEFKGERWLTDEGVAERVAALKAAGAEHVRGFLYVQDGVTSAIFDVRIHAQSYDAAQAQGQWFFDEVGLPRVDLVVGEEPDAREFA